MNLPTKKLPAGALEEAPEVRRRHDPPAMKQGGDGVPGASKLDRGVLAQPPPPSETAGGAPCESLHDAEHGSMRTMWAVIYEHVCGDDPFGPAAEVYPGKDDAEKEVERLFREALELSHVDTSDMDPADVAGAMERCFHIQARFLCVRVFYGKGVALMAGEDPYERILAHCGEGLEE